MTTVSTEQAIVYSDVNLELGTTSSYELVYNEDALRGAIINILLTQRGTRPFRRRLGSSIQELLFAPLDAVTARRMQLRIKEDLAVLTDRLTFTKVEVLPSFKDDAYYIEIVCVARALSRQFSLNFNLNRTVT